MPQPFIKFFFADWEGDAQLMACSLAARGLWVHMLRVMAESERYGYFLGREGQIVTPAVFARRIGTDIKTVRNLIKELEIQGVFSRNSAGEIFSRRLVRDQEKRVAAVEFGKIGGSPTLKGTLNPTLNPTLKVRATRVPKPQSISSSGVDTPSDGPTRKKREKPEPDTAWVAVVEQRARDLAKLAMRSWSPEQRFTAAQYHCLKFGNCTKQEVRNKAKATDVAGAFASMGRSKDFGDMTIGEYVGYARKVHANREEKPWFDPWMVRGVVEFEGAA